MSAHNNREVRNFVFGTAGHIDHGKTSLVRALTGIDTDRLAEEKKRGISIDLGFAHFTLPNGFCINLVDVPGHEKFIKNMLAGVGGIQAVLLVIAADELVKPQTREHFDICRLLGLRHGLIALTKSDLVSAERLTSAIEKVGELSAGSFLEGSPVVPVSAKTGFGIEEIKYQISAVAQRIIPRDTNGIARLPVDRSFSMPGFGTIVTGTLWSGRLRAGDGVRLQGSNETLRIRGLQVNGQTVSQAIAGQRTAINLAGIESSRITRGQVLTDSSELCTTGTLDVSIKWLQRVDDSRRRFPVTLHIGTSELGAGLKILDFAEGDTVARLSLQEQVLALPGDRFVMRTASPAQTIAGGRVIDPFPVIRTSRIKTVSRLRSLQNAELIQRVQLLVDESSQGRRVSDLVRLTGLDTSQLKEIVAANPALLFAQSTQRAISKHWLEHHVQNLICFLQEFHLKNPSLEGAPLSAARHGMEPLLAQVVFEHASNIVAKGDIIFLVGHKAKQSDQESKLLAAIEDAYRGAGFQPPHIDEVLRHASANTKQASFLLESLVKQKKLIRVSPDLIFHCDVLTHIRTSLAQHKGHRFSVPEFKDWTKISRKYAIPLLEYLDRERVTRRVGEARVVL